MGLHISDENLLEEVGALIKYEYTPEKHFEDNILAGIQVGDFHTLHKQPVYFWIY